MAPLNKKPTKKKKAELARDTWVNLSGTWYKQWREKAQKSYDFSLGSQLTKEEEEDLNSAGMPTFIINRIMPIVEIVKYFATSGDPKWQAIGTDGSDSDIAHLHATVSEYDWYNSNGRSVLSNVMNNCLTKGVGYFFVDVDPDAARGTGEVRFSSIESWDVYIDPRARDMWYRDASVIMIKKDFPRTHLQQKLPRYAAIIARASGEQDDASYTERDIDESPSIQYEEIKDVITPDGDSSEDTLAYYETYRKKRVPYVNVYISVPPSEKQMKEGKKRVDMMMKEFKQEQQVKLLELQGQLDEAVQQGDMIPERRMFELEKAQKEAEIAVVDLEQRLMSELRDELTKIENKIVTKAEFDILIANPAIAETITNFYNYYETRVEKEVVVGNKFLYSELENYSEYRIVPLPFYWTGTVYPMSFVLPLIGKQQEINKSHQIVIHHANLSSNLRWMYVEGEIDEEEWETNSTQPSGLLKVRPGLSTNGPREIMPQPINNAFYTITKEGESDLEYLAGIQPSVMGITKDQPETYRGLLASDEYGTRRIRQWITNVLEPTMEQLGKVHSMVARQTYDVNKIFRLVQPTAGQPDIKKAEINIPMYDDFGEVVGRYNDYQAVQFDVRFIAGSTMPMNRWALLEEYKSLFELGIVDDIEVRKHTDVRNKEALNERFSRMAQLNSALEARDEEIKSLKGDIETLRRGILMQSLRADKAEMVGEEKKAVYETKSQEKIKQGELKNSVALAQAAMDLEKQKIKANIKDNDKK